VEEEHSGQKELQDRVVRTGLCTGCGACVGLCPYQTSYEDRLVFLNRCDLKSGRCYAFCPRTPTDLQALREALFDRADLTPEIGAVRGFYLARARDSRIREKAQHGGSVTALIHLALKEGLIGEAVLTGAGEDLLPRSVRIGDPEEVPGLAKSRFVVSPVLGLFNRLAVDGPGKIGIVATPCQALALGKMRVKTDKRKPGPVDRLKLVIGLFCGWALSWERLRGLLQEKAGTSPIFGMDVPPSRYHSLDVHTATGTMTVSLDEVTPCVREACWSCFDMTSEFADISVGSARLPEGWEEARHWNQILVRTREGEELLALAKTRGILEFRVVPEGNLDRLKQASMNKKHAAVRNLVKRSGSEKDLIYLDRNDPTLQGW
jgi:coenzyme F420 hydrogenase subunit beta